MLISYEMVQKALWYDAEVLQDEKFKNAVDSANGMIESYIWNYEPGTKNKQVLTKYKNLANWYIPLFHTLWNITNVKVNWTEIKDFKLIQNFWYIYSTEICKFANSSLPVVDYSYDFEFENWQIPAILISAVSELAWFYFDKENGKEIKKQSLGPRSVEFGWSWNWWDDEFFKNNIYPKIKFFIPKFWRMWHV